MFSYRAQTAFICHHDNHWLTIRKLGRQVRPVVYHTCTHSKGLVMPVYTLNMYYGPRIMPYSVVLKIGRYFICVFMFFKDFQILGAIFTSIQFLALLKFSFLIINSSRNSIFLAVVQPQFPASQTRAYLWHLPQSLPHTATDGRFVQS